MKFFNKYKTVIISIICLIIMLAFVVLWNMIIVKNDKESENSNIDLGRVNNVSSVESKLGEDIKITQNYLLTYTSNKASIWYMSSAYVKAIKYDEMDAIITLTDSESGNTKISGTIDKDKCDVKSGDIVNFVGTIDLSTGMIELTKISNDTIDYKNVTEIDFKDLVNNIQKVKSNYFIVIGYMVTDGDKYKLFDSKEDYSKNNNAGTYFLLNWKDAFMYTGNQKVTVKCLIEDTYKLNMCELFE